MWSRKILKRNGWNNLKKNYWRILGISLLIAFIASGLKVTQHLDNAAMYFADRGFAQSSSAYKEDEWHTSIGERSQLGNNRVIEFLGQRYEAKKGILARVYNRMIQEKSALYGFVKAINDIFFKDKATQGMVILAGVALLLLFYTFVSNVLRVGQCRFLLENRAYAQSKTSGLLFPWKVKRGKKTALAMFKKDIFLFFWNWTIIGGVIKRYSYKMIPYILAENPDIGHKEVFALSRQMMRGNKMKAFLLDLSFLGWRFLSIFTMGILKHVWITPYIEVVYAELYAVLRKEAVAKRYPYAEYLNDDLLFAESKAEDYPAEKHPLYNPKSKQWIKLEYCRKYSVRSLILIFFTFSIIGWLWEVALHLFGDGEFVNRGFFHGPWLPIYGAGGVLVVVLLQRFVKKPLLTFFMAMFVCGTVEYFTGYFLWEFKRMYWWNYSGYFLNLDGRICAEGLIIFGLGGCVFLYLAAPFFDEVFKRIPRKTAILLCVILLGVFAVDGAYSVIHPNSGAGITSYELPY